MDIARKSKLVYVSFGVVNLFTKISEEDKNWSLRRTI